MALIANQLRKHYAGLLALDSVSLRVAPGHILALIGPNGAGKSTLFEVLSGMRKADGGQVLLDDRDITALPPWQRCRLGMARTFQVVRPLGAMSVLDNVKVGAFARCRQAAGARSAALEALEQVGLVDRADQLALSLTLLQRKQLELAKALATGPKYLLLDECFAGLRAGEQDQSMALMRRLADQGLGLVLVEHSMRLVMSLAEEVIVLHHGKKIASGPPAEIVANAEVRAAYLGARDAVR